MGTDGLAEDTMALGAGQVTPAAPDFSVNVEHEFDVLDQTWYHRVWVKMAVSIRTGGLLAALGPENLHTLVALSTYMDENGACEPAEETIAHDLQVHRTTAIRRLSNLCDFRWQGRAVVTRTRVRTTGGRWTHNRYTILPSAGFSFGPDRAPGPSESGNPHPAAAPTEMSPAVHVARMQHGGEPPAPARPSMSHPCDMDKSLAPQGGDPCRVRATSHRCDTNKTLSIKDNNNTGPIAHAPACASSSSDACAREDAQGEGRPAPEQAPAVLAPRDVVAVRPAGPESEAPEAARPESGLAMPTPVRPVAALGPATGHPGEALAAAPTARMETPAVAQVAPDPAVAANPSMSQPRDPNDTTAPQGSTPGDDGVAPATDGTGRPVAAAVETAPAVLAPRDVVAALPTDPESGAPGHPEARMAQPTQALRALPLGLLLDQALPRGVAPVVGPPDEPPGLVAPAPAEDCMAPTPALDLAAVCAAYHAATGRDDLHLEADALRAVVQARPLTAAYVDAKIDLLRTAMDAGRVRSPRRFFVAALVQDWTPETAPRGAEPARAPDPGPAPPTEPRGDAATLADRLAQLGVAGPVAERLARDDPAAVAQQLAWLPYRRATDPAAVVVRAIREHWSEPPAAWSARTAEAQRREHERWAADMRRLEAESRTPAGRRLAHEGLAAMRRILGMPDRRSA